jgi:hypothetical protein
MLFVVVAKGGLLIVRMGGFGLWWRRNDMIGSITKVVFVMLVDALVLGVGVDTKDSMIMMIVVSVLCG